MNIFQRISRSVKVKRVNRALDIKLTDYQIVHIFDGEPFPEDVQRSRQSGKTTAQILYVLLHDFGDLDCPLLRIGDIKFWDGLSVTPESVAAERAHIFGDDGLNYRRRYLFVKEMLKIRERLKKRRIKTNRVCVVYQGRRHTYI